MRIIAGKLKGRAVSLPKNSRIRPATGYVREMAMSLFTPARLERGGFADICAGSGLIGFEGLSRGARYSVFVEADVRTAADLRENAARFGVDREVVVLRSDARRSWGKLTELAATRGKLSCAFLDAPYIPGMAESILERLSGALETGAAAGLFQKDALLIARTPDDLRLEWLAGLAHVETRAASGDARLWLFTPRVELSVA